jgi:hypothetical protein
MGKGESAGVAAADACSGEVGTAHVAWVGVRVTWRLQH